MESKYQYSKKLENGEIVLVRSEKLEDFMKDVADMRANFPDAPAVTYSSTAPVTAVRTVPIEQMSGSVDICPTHNVPYDKSGVSKKNGKPYSMHKLSDGSACFKRSY